MKRKDGNSFISMERTMAARKNEREEFLPRNEQFRKKARVIIDKMTELNWLTRENTSLLVDEILHSIFFMGKIHDPPIPPECILTDDGDLEALKHYYPRPFELYSCQLPRRSPFSCVLDMMVLLVGQENEEEIRNRLQQFISDVEGGVPSKHLVSNRICVSQKSKDSIRYYGVSMPTFGCNAGRIMIAASCLSAWDDYVAGAVMTYNPKEKKKYSKKNYFDGTIKIPTYVRCQAFEFKREGNIEEMPPCRSCGNLFGLNTDETREWPYGNCAEAESLSNLLKNEREVKQQSQPTSHTWTPENIQRAREDVLKELKKVLNMIHFKWDGHFYIPQAE